MTLNTGSPRVFVARKITVNLYMTLDGFGEFPQYPGSDYVPKGSDEFWKEIWISQYDSVDTIIFGRESYEGHARVHALSKRKSTDPEYMFEYSRFLEKCNKIVLSHTLKKGSWGDPRIESGDLTEIINRIKKEPGKNIIVEGGPSLVHECIQRGLADDYRMLVMPVIMGKGHNYWGTMSNQQTMKLISVKTLQYGELILHYESVRQ